MSEDRAKSVDAPASEESRDGGVEDGAVHYCGGALARASPAAAASSATAMVAFLRSASAATVEAVDDVDGGGGGGGVVRERAGSRGAISAHEGTHSGVTAASPAPRRSSRRRTSRQVQDDSSSPASPAGGLPPRPQTPSTGDGRTRSRSRRTESGGGGSLSHGESRRSPSSERVPSGDESAGAPAGSEASARSLSFSVRDLHPAMCPLWSPSVASNYSSSEGDALALAAPSY